MLPASDPICLHTAQRKRMLPANASGLISLLVSIMIELDSRRAGRGLWTEIMYSLPITAPPSVHPLSGDPYEGQLYAQVGGAAPELVLLRGVVECCCVSNRFLLMLNNSGDGFYSMDLQKRSVPTHHSVPNLDRSDRLASISCPNNFGILLSFSGRLFMFDVHSSNQQIRELWPNKRFFKIACGGNRLMALTDKSVLYTSDRLTSDPPLTVGTSMSFAGQVFSMACHETHALLLTTDGLVYSFGTNSNGQLGHGHIRDITEPLLISSLANVSCIAVGRHHSAAVAMGKCYCWGRCDKGQLGVGVTPNGQVQVPTVVDLEGVKAVSCGHSHTVALTETSQVWTWGNLAALGLGNQTYRYSPVLVDAFHGTRISRVVCHEASTIALTAPSFVAALTFTNVGDSLGAIRTQSWKDSPLPPPPSSDCTTLGSQRCSQVFDIENFWKTKFEEESCLRSAAEARVDSLETIVEKLESKLDFYTAALVQKECLLQESEDDRLRLATTVVDLKHKLAVETDLAKQYLSTQTASLARRLAESEAERLDLLQRLEDVER